jgi:hypothetical protein
MSDYNVTAEQSTKFVIKQLYVVAPDGSKYDLSDVYQELNLFDNLFMPCVSGNIQVTDAVDFGGKLQLFKGNRKLKIIIDKSLEYVPGLRYEKEFIIYKHTNLKNLNMSSKTYTLHFVSEEFLLSMQKKVSQNYVGKYSDIAATILEDELKVPASAPRNGLGGMGTIYPSDGPQNIIIPALTPFDAINWVTKRTVSTYSNDGGDPDYVFFETAQEGYSFAPLRYFMDLPSSFSINFNPKNLTDNLAQEFTGARDMKVLSNFSLIDTVKDGVYAGKFVGFDTLTKTFKITSVKTVFEKGSKQNNLADGLNKEKKKYSDMDDSRVVVYPFATPRLTDSYIQENSAEEVNFADNTQDYIFQRKAIFSNLMQRRLQLMMPGNFALFSGSTVDVTVPKYAIDDGRGTRDTSLSGKYIITGTRHVIRADKHETLIEVATDNIEN